MYTSGPKKVGLFPPGFVPPSSPSAAGGGSPKTSIHQGTIFNNSTSASGGALSAAGALPKHPAKSSSSALPQAPKLPVVPNPKYGMPGMGKLPFPTSSSNNSVPGAQQTPISAGPPKFPPPSASPPLVTPAQQPPPIDDSPFSDVGIDDEPPPPPEWIDEAPLTPKETPTRSSPPPFNPPSMPTGAPPKFAPPSMPANAPPTNPSPSVPNMRPISGDFSGSSIPKMAPPAVPKTRPMSMQIGATIPGIPKTMPPAAPVAVVPQAGPPKQFSPFAGPPLNQPPKQPPMTTPPPALSKTPPPTIGQPGHVGIPVQGTPGSVKIPIAAPPGMTKGPIPVGPPPNMVNGVPKMPMQPPMQPKGPGAQPQFPTATQPPSFIPPGANGMPTQPPKFAPPGAVPPQPMTMPPVSMAPKFAPPGQTPSPQIPIANVPPSFAPPTFAPPQAVARPAQAPPATPRAKAKLHPLLPCPIPPTDPTMPVQAPIEPFPLRFLVSKGETKMITCSPGSTVIELLTDAMFDLLEHVDGDDFITYHLLCGDEQETIDNSATVSDSKYVQECLARGTAPSVLLKPSNTLTDLDDLVVDEEPVTEVDPNVAAAAALSADLGFQLPDYAIQKSTPATAAPIATQPSSSVPTITAPANPEPTYAPEITKQATTIEQQSPPEVSQTTDLSMPDAAPFSTPSDAPKPNYRPPQAYAMPGTPNAAGLDGGNSRSPGSSSRIANMRPSVSSLTGSRKSIFEHAAIKHRSVATKHTVDTSYTARFSLPFNDAEVPLVLEEHDSITKVKALLTQHVRETMGIEMGGDRYLLKVPGASFLTNENEVLKSLPYVHNCLMRGSQPMFTLLEKTSEEAKRIKKNNVEIGALIGRPLSWVQQDDEITSFRQSMTRLRYFERQKQDATQAKETDQVAGLPIHVGAIVAPTGPNNQTLVSLTLELLQVKKKVPVKADETAAQFIQSHVEKQYHKQGKTTKAWNEFILKPAGLAEYIYGPYALHSFDYVRECIAKNKPVELMLVALEDVQRAKNQPTSSAPNGSQSSPPGSISSISKTSETDESLEDESFLLDDPKPKYDQAEISIGKKAAEQMSCISIWDMHRPFRLKIVGVENVSPISNSFMAAYSAAVSSSKIPSNCDDCPLYLYLTAELYHGGELIDQPWCSSIVPASNNPRWYEWAKFQVSMANLPRAVRVCFTAWVAKKPVRTEYTDIPLAWVNFQLFDYKHELKTGSQNFKMWPDDKANPIGTTVSYDGKNPTTLYIDLDTYQLPVVFPTEPVAFPPYPVPTSMTNKEQAHVLRISESDPLYRMTKREKQLMWKYREFCKSRPKALPKFLASVPKADARAVQEMHRLLKIWAPIAPIDALELLDSKFADAEVREYAVRRLEQLSREELLDYLLQLVQVLKYEPYHQTAFAELLVRAALSNKAIGHHFFWYLKSEIHVPEISERFGLLLEAYLRGCGPHRAQLAQQNDLQLKFVKAANMIKPLKDSERLAALRAELSQLSFNRDGVAIPLNPRIEISGLKVEKCKYMDSKKLPLWLVFQNADPKGSDPYVIFKSGDDLRQDMLTLQMIRIMDHLWKKSDLDFLLNAYGCISTGDEVGMIEVVLNSMTTAAITRTAGGATAAFREDPIDNWIRENNPTDGAYRLAKDRFIYSCAGYCVATYVLGIGDRHNDNIMLTKDGRLFHIDFGHFLGNFKKKFGVKRERAPFVFTPDFAYVMGGKDAPDFNRFLDLCARAYNVLRKHANIFINLFAMMLSTGIPELRTTDDIQYLRDAFSLDLNEQQAAQKFTELVYESMSSRTTQLNNAIHIWAH